MNPFSENFYSRWREKAREQNFLRDEHFPNERLLQSIWQHQRLCRNELKTADGKTVRIFHPGFLSVEGGPDFRNAVLQIGDDAPRSGDVEIDLHANGWRAHSHDKNPSFKNVLLHVIWEEAKPVENAPTALSLKNALDAPLAELSLSLENESLPENLRGKCCAPLRELDETKLTELLQQAASVRFENKASYFRARAKNVGWEQTFWENLFRALGYKHNVWPMQNLAETKSRWSPGSKFAFEFQARLLGISGLLPDQLTRAQKSSDTYLRHAWDFWWRERDEFENCILPRAVWKFHGLRPANHPQRRMALASHWLADKNFISKIEKWSAMDFPTHRSSGRKSALISNFEPTHVGCYKSLKEILQVERDEFWSWHWTFKSARLKKPQPLLGDARVTDLAVNVILPWLWIRAKEGGNEKIQNEIERRYFSWPAAEDNSVLKLARQRLLGVLNAKNFKTAAAQQGLMQIVRDFCEHSNAICENCPFPELVSGWKISA
ncbi:MAG TPA: DUF2851 family protein [Methylomirabilota bacterium]|nr:DUF2851 family protein [Methylomirabilota bacterium]